jgi:sulfate adenylyltransferase subunit 2
MPDYVAICVFKKIMKQYILSINLYELRHMTNDQILDSLTASGIWDTSRAHELLETKGESGAKRSTERKLHELGIVPELIAPESIVDECGEKLNTLLLDRALEEARSKRRLVLFVQVHTLTNGKVLLAANDARSARYWTALGSVWHTLSHPEQAAHLLGALTELQKYIGKAIHVFGHGPIVALLRDQPSNGDVYFSAGIYTPVLNLTQSGNHRATVTPHLKHLEAESIHIFREAVAEAENPAMLYSVGKDSAVMLHLARKAFYPSAPPMPLVHVDTRWKFQEMYKFRDYMARESGMDLIVHINPEAVERDINPFDHGSALHTDITKTEGLKQVLDKHKFDIVFGGARRDEEKSRAKERIFSFRSKTHRWDPKQQRPELWNLFNTRKAQGESIRVFPLSNWTELDIWQYIYQEDIPVVPLYFAKVRPVVIRDGLILMIDDNRFKLLPDEQIEERLVRFRTLGCYPLTGAAESQATNLPEIILELVNARSSERQGRAIDSDAAASMEKKKQEGYF